MSGYPPSKMSKVFSLEDLEVAAKRYLPRPIFGFVEGGAETNAARIDNRAVFNEISLLPRVLRNVSQRQLECTLMGRSLKLPFGIAPMGISAVSAYRGDIALASAAHAKGIPMIISATSIIRLEDIAKDRDHIWFQAYLPRELDDIYKLIFRVQKADIEVLVITIDTTVAPSRENNLRTGFKTPMRPNLRLAYDGITHPSWAIGTFLKTFLTSGIPYFENASAERGVPLLLTLTPSLVRSL